MYTLCKNCVALEAVHFVCMEGGRGVSPSKIVCVCTGTLHYVYAIMGENIKNTHACMFVFVLNEQPLPGHNMTDNKWRN